MHLKWTDEASLRRLAEEGVIRTSLQRNPAARREPLLYDLLVHKAELEMQNEALRDAQAELTSAHERYKVLFENAPIAYLVLDARCRITAANQRAAKLFGAPPSALLGARLTRHLVPDEAIPFERYRREVTESSTAVAAEFTMMVAGGEQREIRLESVSTNGAGAEWFVAVTDATTGIGTVRRLDHAERLRAVEQRAGSVAPSLTEISYVPPLPEEAAGQDEPFATVLIVKDDPGVASEIASQLREAGCDVLCSGSGADALELLRHARKSLNVLLIDEAYPDFVVAELVRVARDVSSWIEIVVTPLGASAVDSTEESSNPLENAVDLALCAGVRAKVQ